MLSLRIALRYLVARKSHGAVNIITIISVVGIVLAAAAMVVVLSIFNGFRDLSAEHLSRLDAELRVSRTDGRPIADADFLARAIQDLPAVAEAAPVVTERALMVTPTAQTPVVIKGFDASPAAVRHLDSLMMDGRYATSTLTADIPAVQIAVGVANSLMLRADGVTPVSLYVPRRAGRINPANPAAAFRGEEAVVSGVFHVDQPDIDRDHVLVPLYVARSLLDYDRQASAIELTLSPAGRKAGTDAVAETVSRRIGDEYTVADRLRQRAEAFRMISVEKWITFMMMIFVLIIALFNIVSTLSLLIIEKRDNMRTLRALGATRTMTQRIFTIEGWLISVAGGILGIIFGIALTLLQQHFGIITLNGDPSLLTVTAYPVRLAGADIVIVFAAVLVTGLLTSIITRIFTPVEYDKKP